MTLPTILKTSVSLLLKGDWREIRLRTLIALGRIDLKTVTVDKLNLSPDLAYSYSDSGRDDLKRVLTALEIKRGDAIIDFGCGKGGVLITLADFEFSRITGVEISGELAAIARRNMGRLKLDKVGVVSCDARDFLELDSYNYLYFFNPFPCSVMAAVMENVSRSLRNKPRKLTIIYLNPECHEQIIGNGDFRKVNEFGHASHIFNVYSSEG